MVRFLIGIILAILIIIVGSIIFLENQKALQESRRQSQITPTVIPTITSKPEISKDLVLYNSENYSIYHPQKMTVREEENGIRAFVLIGPSQKGQTEMYDGINFTVITGEYKTQNLREFVDSEIEKMKSDGTSQITQGVLSVSIGDKDGYEFMSRGLGEFRQVYFDAGKNKFIHVTILLEDPTKQGFDKIVEQMLLSLKY